MKDIVDKLLEKTKEIEMFFASGYDSEGKPTIGFRATGKDFMIDDTMWLISAEAFHCIKNFKKIKSVDEMLSIPENEIYIRIRAQGVIYAINACVADIYLGTRSIKDIKKVVPDNIYTFTAYQKDD